MKLIVGALGGLALEETTKTKGDASMKDFDLKTNLFVKASAALTAYQATVNAKYPSPEAERWHDRFLSLFELIQSAGLEAEYEAWKEG